MDDAQLEEPSLLRIMTGIYQCLKDNVDICTVTLGEHGDKAFAVRILSPGWCRSGRSPNHLWGASPRQLEYFYAFVSNGHIGLLQKWLEEGMTTSVEENGPYGLRDIMPTAWTSSRKRPSLELDLHRAVIPAHL